MKVVGLGKAHYWRRVIGVTPKEFNISESLSTKEMELMKSARVQVVGGLLHHRSNSDGDDFSRPSSNSGFIMEADNDDDVGWCSIQVEPQSERVNTIHRSVTLYFHYSRWIISPNIYVNVKPIFKKQRILE